MRTKADPSRWPAGANSTVTPRHDLDRPLVTDRLQLRQRALRVDSRVERQRRLVLRVAVLVGLPRVLFLDAPRVGQHQAAQVQGAGRAEDAPPVALRDQPRQVADVIEMRVGQDDRVEWTRAAPETPPSCAAAAPSAPGTGRSRRARACRSCSSRYLEPVTVRAAPRNVSVSHRPDDISIAPVLISRAMTQTFASAGHRASCMAAVAAAPARAQAPQRTLTVDAIYDPERRVDFSGAPAPDITWLDDATYVTTRRGGARRRVAQGRPRTRERRRRCSTPAQMESALAALPGVTRDEARRLARSPDLTFKRRDTGALLTIVDDLYFYDFTAATRVAADHGRRRRGRGRRSAPTAARRLRPRATTCTSSTSRRGASARSRATAARRSSTASSIGCIRRRSTAAAASAATGGAPIRRALAFLQLDERPVPEYTVVDHMPYRPDARGHRLPEGRRSESAR